MTNSKCYLEPSRKGLNSLDGGEGEQLGEGVDQSFYQLCGHQNAAGHVQDIYKSLQGLRLETRVIIAVQGTRTWWYQVLTDFYKQNSSVTGGQTIIPGGPFLWNSDLIKYVDELIFHLLPNFSPQSLIEEIPKNGAVVCQWLTWGRIQHLRLVVLFDRTVWLPNFWLN